MKNTNYIKNYKKLMETLNMFDITTLKYSLDINTDSKYNKEKLQAFLQKYNFIFMNHNTPLKI